MKANSPRFAEALIQLSASATSVAGGAVCAPRHDAVGRGEAGRIAGAATGAGSISGALQRGPAPAAMLARGSRVTGSGGAGASTAPASGSVAGRAIARAEDRYDLGNGASFTFASVGDMAEPAFG